MGLGSNTNKQILLLVNFIIAVLGLVLIGFGIFLLVSDSESAFGNGQTVAGCLVIFLGCAAVAVSIFGCLSAIHESYKRLLAYVIVLVILILVQLIMCSMASMGTQDGLAGSVHEGFAELWEYELKEPGSLAYYEDWLHCCGVNNTADYHRIGHPIPDSCCVGHNCNAIENIYQIGCDEKLQEYLYERFLAFQIVAYLLILFEIVGAVLGWMLFSRLRNEKRRGRVDWM